MTTEAKSKLPIIIIQHNSMETRYLAKLSKVITETLKGIYPEDHHVVHRSFTGNEIVIRLEIVKIIA